MEPNTEKNRKIKKSAFFVIIITALACLLLPGAYMQQYFGSLGLIASELLLLITAVVSVALMKGSFKEAFPVKKPSARQLFGSLMVYVGGYILIIAGTAALYYFFPEEYNNTQSGLSEALHLESFALSLVITALLPALCEEALFRGALYYSAGWMKNKIFVCFLIGIIFGAFHLDFIRFLPTAILGVIFTYTLYKTNNIIYPVLLHFINNTFSVISMYATDAATSNLPSSLPLSAIASYLMISSVAPFLIAAGINLLEPKRDKYLKYYGANDESSLKSKQRRTIATVFALALFIPGSIILSGDIKSRQDVINTTITTNINCDSLPESLKFTIPSDNIYTFTYEISNERGLIEMLLVNDKGEQLEQEIFRNLDTEWQYYLTEGDYEIRIIYHIKDVWEFSKENNLPYTKEGDLIVLNMDTDLEAYTPVTIKITAR